MSIATPEPGIDDTPAPAPKSAIWQKLQKGYEEISSEREPLMLELPAPYEGVWVRYRYVPLDERKGSMKNIAGLEDETEQGFFASVDLIRDACDAIMVANPDDSRADKDGLAPLADPGDPPIRFDRALARGMEWSNPEMLSGRQIVRKVFGGQQGDYLLLEHARAVGKWMGSERPKVAEEFSKN